ncbi:MAG: DUF2269 family protein [Anaerolineales bacterium]
MFLFLRLLHILGVIMFMGNILTAALWKMRADASGDLHVIAFAQRGVMFADYVFTLPGAALIVVSGLWMTDLSGRNLFQTGWLFTALILLIVALLIWLLELLPVQRRLIRAADEAVRNGQLDPVFKALTLRWTIFGVIAALLPLVNVYLMVFKPF